MERLKEGNPAAGVSFLSRIGIKPGDVVLHVASGYGTDPLQSSRQVGLRGRVIGLDTTWEMVHRGKKTAQEAGADNVEFRFGQMEEMPIEDESIIILSGIRLCCPLDKSQRGG